MVDNDVDDFKRGSTVTLVRNGVYLHFGGTRHLAISMSIKLPDKRHSLNGYVSLVVVG